MAKDEETRLLGGGKAHKNRAFNAIFELPPALACFCILSGVIVVVGFLTFCMWLLALEWNVALYAKHHNVTCDKPLGKWLMAEAAFVSSLLVIYAVIIAWKGNQRNMLMSILAVVTNLGVLILLIMGNSMVFGSKNCKTSTADKIPEPTPLMMSLYNTCKFIVVFSDVLFALALVFIGIAYSHITNPSDSTKGCAALMKGFSLQMAAEDNVSFIGAALRFFQKKSATDEPKKVSPDEESEAEPDVEQPLVDGDQPASDDHSKSQ